MQGVTQDLETGGQNRGFLKFKGSKVSYPINKNDHSSLMYWLGKTKCDSLCHLMYLLSSMSETFEILPWTQTNTENLAKYNWVSFSPKSCVWESKWLPGGWLGKSLSPWKTKGWWTCSSAFGKTDCITRLGLSFGQRLFPHPCMKMSFTSVILIYDDLRTAYELRINWQKIIRRKIRLDSDSDIFKRKKC